MAKARLKTYPPTVTVGPPKQEEAGVRVKLSEEAKEFIRKKLAEAEVEKE